MKWWHVVLIVLAVLSSCVTITWYPGDFNDSSREVAYITFLDMVPSNKKLGSLLSLKVWSDHRYSMIFYTEDNKDTGAFFVGTLPDGLYEKVSSLEPWKRNIIGGQDVLFSVNSICVQSQQEIDTLKFVITNAVPGTSSNEHDIRKYGIRKELRDALFKDPPDEKR